MAGPIFLGLDASTQSLKASLLSNDLDVLSEVAINFDADLPGYGTKGGVLHGPEGSGEVFSPVMMVVEAMDLLFNKIKAAGWDTGSIRGVSAAGQMKGAFSRDIIPNWQDSSTTSECRAMESALGGPTQLAQATGSKAHERFTGAQIMRWKALDSQAYDNTERISLVSSFITTLLCLDGEVKGIDESDACGMNLWSMDRGHRGWNEDVMRAIVGPLGDVTELERKLGTVETDGGRVVGQIGNWFVGRYGFDPACCVFPGTGDNPATFLSSTLRTSEGLMSLGTSDVILVSTEEYNPHPEYHAFFHPAQIGPPSKQDTASEERQNTSLRYFNMLVYKNGSLAREHVRDEYYAKDWSAFNASIEAGRPTRGEQKPAEAAFWWLLPDIIPDGASGIHKYLSPSPSLEPSSFVSTAEFSNPSSNALRMIESQFLNYRSRSSAILRSASDTSASPKSLTRVYAAGGASKNDAIISLAADILGAPICKNVEYDPETQEWKEAGWNLCSVGVAFKAKWGYERHLAEGARKWIGFDEVIQECRDRRAARRGGGKTGGEEEGIKVVAKPGPGAEAYTAWVGWWAAMEERALRGE